MKRILSLLLACAMGLPMLSGCSQSNTRELTATPIKLTQDDMMAHNLDALTVYAALSDFGLDLLKQTRTANGEKAMASEIDHTPFSTLVSPLSVALALSMTANGADGNTLAQFQDVLGGGVDLVELNTACAQLMADYQGLGGSTKCAIANSLWVDPEGQIKDEFIGQCRGIYDAQVFSAQLSEPGIVKDLNSWVSQHTNKMIPEIIDQMAPGVRPPGHPGDGLPPRRRARQPDGVPVQAQHGAVLYSGQGSPGGGAALRRRAAGLLRNSARFVPGFP